MTLYDFTGNTKAKASQVNNDFNESLRASGHNLITQLEDRAIFMSIDGGIYADAYIDTTGQNNEVSVNETSATFDSDKYAVPTDNYSAYFVIIEATSVSSLGDFAINECLLKPHVDGGKWMLYCTNADAEVQRAQVMKTLFYGSDGSNPRAEATYISSCTAMKSSDARDVGKRGHYAKMTGTRENSSVGTYTGTFADTSTNTSCSSWSKVVSGTGFYTAGGLAQWEIPTSTVVNSKVYSSSGTSDELGTDTSGDEDDNPVSSQIEIKYLKDIGSNVESIIVCSGDITWVEVDAEGPNDYTVTNTDFYTDNSMPDFTDGSAEVTTNYVNIIWHTIEANRFSATIGSSFLTFIADDWESGASIVYKLTGAGEDTGWLDANEISTFTAFASEPTDLLIKLVPKSSAPTANYPAIKGFALYGDRPA